MPATLDFGAHRVGAAIDSQSITVSNAAATSAYSENLKATYSGSTVPFSFNKSGSSDTIAAGSYVTGTIALSSATAGDFTGANQGKINIGFTSLAGAAGLSDTGLASQTVSLSGKIYAEAVADVQTPALNFGIVHVGDVIAAHSISVKNSATGALTDVLNAMVSSAPASFSAGSTAVNSLAAGAVDATSLNVSLDTSKNGVFNGNANLAFSSYDADLGGLALAGQTVALSAQVNNYADAAYAQVGGEGSFSSSGHNFTLDFGTISKGSDLLTSLAILNIANGFADTLGGSFQFSGNGFALSGNNPFSGIAAGGQQTGLAIDFNTAALAAGNYSADLIFQGIGSNASGYSAAIGSYDLHITGTVGAVSSVPLPPAVWLFGVGLSGLVSIGRKKTS